MIECRVDTVEALRLKEGMYIMEDRNAGTILESGKMRSVDVHRPPLGGNAEDYREETEIHLVKSGGIGDLIWLTPILRKLRADGKTPHIHTFTQYHEIFEGLESNPVMNLYPVVDSGLKSGMWVELENAIEDNPKSHILDCMSDRVGIPRLVGDERRPEYRVSPQERVDALTRFPVVYQGEPGPDAPREPRIALQWKSSALYRNYHHWPEVVYALWQRGYQILILGAPGEVEGEQNDRVTFLPMAEPPLTLRQSVAVLSTCDLLLAPDSSMVHFAAALESPIPTVGVFGPIHWKYRGVDYSKQAAKDQRFLQGFAACAPCNFHAAGLSHWPNGMKCAKTGSCIALERVKPNRILKTVAKILG